VEATPSQVEAVKNAVHAMVYIAQLVEVLISFSSAIFCFNASY